MISYEQKKYIQSIAAEVKLREDGDLIKTAYNLLVRSDRAGQATETTVQNFGFAKEVQGDYLLDFCKRNNCLLPHPKISLPYLTEGGEAKIYFDGKRVYKVNTAVFYQSWLDYLKNLLVHNCIFSATRYHLIGFCLNEKSLNAVLTQPYVRCDQNTNLHLVKSELEELGFILQRRNDYLHPQLNLILEDMHDENVLFREDRLFFIDTVFYFKRDIV